MNINDFEIKNGTLVKYNGNDARIIIPNSVKIIGERAFDDCNYIRNVSIPSSVTHIEKDAFSHCVSLTKVNIPNSVIAIGDYAFWGCELLAYINIANSVNTIGSHAFCNCKFLTSISIPDSVRSIGDYAFSGCAGLKDIFIPKSVISIGKSILSRCPSLTNITIDMDNQHYKTIDGNIYSKDGTCLLQYAGGKQDLSFSIPNHVTNIDGAFLGCNFLEYIIIPNSVKSMEWAFACSESLERVSLPSNITSISEGAFCGCKSLKKIIIPNSVTVIERFAFENCSSIENIVIPNSVKSLGENAFAKCYKTTIFIPDYIECDVHTTFDGCRDIKSNKLAPVSEEPNDFSNFSSNYVFISYSTRNQDYAEAVLHLLKDEKIGVWMAPYDIPAGSKYAHVINNAIKNCSCALLLLSEQSQASVWVDKEIERACNYKKTVISMHLDDSQLNDSFSFYLGNQQIVPVKTIDQNNPSVIKVLNAIKSFLK